MKKFFSAVWRIIRSNLLLKIMSVLFAIILWSYVLAETNPLRTREIQNVPVRYTHADELEAKNLAISGSLSDVLDSVNVRVEVRQSDLRYVNNKNIFAEVNLSTITGTGEHTLSITATSTHGEVLSISPSQVTLNIDDLVTRTIPVTVETIGTVPEGYHAMPPVINPPVISITGARVDVEKIISSVCTIDLNGLTEGYVESVEVQLLDIDGNRIDKNLFRGSIPSVIVNLEVLAKKTVPVDISDMLLGQDELAEGYEISNIIIEPETVDIIGTKDILDKIRSVGVVSLSVKGADSDIVALLDFKLPEGVSLLSEDQIEVYVSIKEIAEVRIYENVPIVVKNLTRGLSASLDINDIDVKVIAGVNQLKLLFKEDIVAYVDVDGLTEGTYELTISYTLPDGFANKNVTSSTKSVTVTITK